MGDVLDAWRRWYLRAGLQTIPYRANGKRPVCEGWNVVLPDDQWRQVGADFRGNIGVVTGGPSGVAVADCDDVPTVAAVAAGLAGLGVDPVVVHTAGVDHPGGRHLWVRLSGVPPNITTRKFSPSVGAGELLVRWPATAPCSSIAGRHYTFEQGGPDTIAALPVVPWADITWLVQAGLPPGARTYVVPIRLLEREAPPAALELLALSRQVRKGDPVITYDERGRVKRAYTSRSEAEAAAVSMLVLAGMSFPAICGMFADIMPAHYREHRKPRQYLDGMYRQVVASIASHPQRVAIAAEWHAAASASWGGALELDVYRGLLALCWQFASWQVAASTRDLALYAAASVAGVSAAVYRLELRGLVQVVAPGRGRQAAVFAVARREISNTSNSKLGGSAPGGANCGNSDGNSDRSGAMRVVVPAGVQEIWAPAVLGRSAERVYEHLGDVPISVTELVSATGKHRDTVKVALERLCGVGLADREGEEGWIRGRVVTLAMVGMLSDVRERAARRRRRHDDERQMWEQVIADRERG